MQLEAKNIRQTLAVATCAVLGGGAQAASADSEWRIDSSLLYYSEQDRVSVVEPVVFATRQLGEEESVTVKAVYDSMTGASPNGAAPTDRVQTFTGASGETTYSTPAGETPMRSFSDSRIALGVDWSKRTSPLVTRTLGLNASGEEDYSSLGGSVSYARDFNQKLTTLAFGLGLSLDLVNPHSPVPEGLRSTSLPVEDTTTGASGLNGEQKTLADLLLGVTQVLSRRTLLQVNYTHSELSGYLTDPYKIVSVVSPTTGETLDYVYEKRPDERSANALYWKLVHHFDRDVAHLSYRYFADDWGIDSHTAELQYHWKLGEKLYIEPQLRYYTQSAADFYHHSLLDGAAVDYASADLRLGEMESRTVGVKLGTELAGGNLSFRYALMRQTGDHHPDDAVGIQKGLDLYPTLDAVMINLDYSLTF